MEEEKTVYEGDVITEKRTLKQRWKESRLRQWISDHPDVACSIVGGAFTIVGVVGKAIYDVMNYDDTAYVPVDTKDGLRTAKVRVKYVDTIKPKEELKSSKVVKEEKK